MSGIALKGSATGSANVEVAAPVTNTALTYDMPKHGGKVAAFGAPAAKTATGTAVDFINGTGDVVIPDDARRITVMLDGVSTNGASTVLIQLGDSGGIETTGYLGSGSTVSGSSAASTLYATGFGIGQSNSATDTSHGSVTLTRLSGNTWSCAGVVSLSNTASSKYVSGSKTLSATLDRIRLTTVNGTDAFDAGTVAILVE